MEIKSSDFFRNIKVLPDPGSKEFVQLIDWEIEKCMGGVKVNGVFFPGWLYWHLNHWHIRGDEQDAYGNDIRIKTLPDLRDNEWIRAEALERCRIERKGYMEVGLRQGGKSELEASYLGYNSILFENTQNVIVGGNDADLSLLKDKVDFGLKNLWDGINIPRLDKTWRGNQLKLGYKMPNGDDRIWSYLIIRNSEDGHNTETAAGTTAKSYIMDEVGKYPFAKVYEAAKPAFISKFGMRAVPILVGTGGSFDKGDDAERFFYHPEANNFLAFPNKETGKSTCLFMSGIYRQDCKKDMLLSDWLRQQGVELTDDSELSQITIKVADEELAKATIEKDRELKKQDPDQMEYLKSIMYYPLTPEECFLSQDTNIFNVTAAKNQKKRIAAERITGTNVFLEHDGERIVHVPTNKRPISHFPHKHSDDKDAPIVIWEFPISDPPHGLYTMGVDSYREAKSGNSPSLGAAYVFKRVHNIFDEKYQNMMVASYVARPDDKMKFQDQVRMLAKYYNARVLVENDEISFIDYMISKGDARYLEPEPQYLKSFVKNSTVFRKYGIHRSAEAIRNHLHETFRLYMNNKLSEDKDENGSVVKEYTGIYQILDPMLLEEVIKFNYDGDKADNFDRIVAFELALSLGDYLNRSIGKISSADTDPRLISYFNREKKNKSVFSQTGSIFNKFKKRIF